MKETPANYVDVNELKRCLDDDGTLTLIDARSREEFSEGHVPGAINVGIAQLPEFAERRDSASEGLVVTNDLFGRRCSSSWFLIHLNSSG